MNPNIKDVANKAGVSATTVSAYLNKSAPVNKVTAERIKKVIDEIGYKPNLIARSLRQKKTNIIGLIVGNILSHFYSVIAKSVEDGARKYGFNTILCNGDDDPKKELDYIKVLESLKVEGIIMTPTGKNEDYINSVIRSGINVIFFDRFSDKVNCSSVCVDNATGSYNAVKYLVKQGYKKIAIINGNLEIITAKERLDGYLKVLKEASLSIDNDLIKIGDFKRETGLIKSLELLEGGNKLDSIFSTNLEITKGILSSIKQKGLKIPDDIGLVGFDDSDITQLFNPPITAISQPVYDIGSTAVELMIDEIKSEKGLKRKIVRKILKTRLIERESTRKIK